MFIVSQMNPGQIFSSCFLNVNFNIILPFVAKSPIWPPDSRFSDQHMCVCVCVLYLACIMPLSSFSSGCVRHDTV